MKQKDEPALVERGTVCGAMTSELKPGHYIEEFFAGVRKTNSNRKVDPVTGSREKACKVRGIKLNYSASKLVIFMSLRI
jgi:hypothetical protein